MTTRVLLLILGSVLRLSASAYPMYLDPSSQTVTSGSLVQLTLRLPDTPILLMDPFGSNPHEASLLQAFGLDVYFDPAYLQLQSVTEGSFLSSDGDSTFFFGGLVDNIGGAVTFISDARSGPDGIRPANGGDLLLLTFQAIQATAGTTVNVQNACLQNSHEVNQGAFTCEFSDLASGYAASANVEVDSVPEPSTSLLCGLAVCGLSLVLRLRKNRSIQGIEE